MSPFDEYLCEALSYLDEHMLSQHQPHNKLPPARLQAHAVGMGFQKPSTAAAQSYVRSLLQLWMLAINDNSKHRN